MRMDVLRTRSPEMVRKEISAHLPAYNLIRGIMAEAARVEEIKPGGLSFKGSLHTVRAFEQGHLYDPVRIEADLPRLLELVGQKRASDRPDRYEPRAVKRRPKPRPLLTMPRKEARRLTRRGIILYEKQGERSSCGGWLEHQLMEPAQNSSHCSASPSKRARKWQTASAPSSPQRIPLLFSRSLTTVLHAASM